MRTRRPALLKLLLLGAALTPWLAQAAAQDRANRRARPSPPSPTATADDARSCCRPTR